jgi:hypothetical protein
MVFVYLDVILIFLSSSIKESFYKYCRYVEDGRIMRLAQPIFENYFILNIVDFI